MQTATLFSLFLMGFLGGSHCVGMCGGLSSALVLHLPPHLPRWQMLVVSNSGRIASYVLIGLLLGGLGQWGVSLDQTRLLQMLLSLAANLLLFLVGLYLAGISAAAGRVERLGRPLWRRLNPLLGRILPLRSRAACLAAGLLWGWLPCGLVYSASLYALGSAGFWEGGLLMLAFGLGTLPNLLLAGWFADRLRVLLHRRSVRLSAGLAVSAWALWQLLHLALAVF